MDGETGLCYKSFRRYDLDIGRFRERTMTPLEIIQDFAEASITPEEFERQLRDNQELCVTLKEDPFVPSYIEEPDQYSFAIAQDYSNIECIFNTQSLLSDSLNSRGIAHERSKKYEDMFNLLLKAQQKWLSLTSSYLSNLLNLAPSQKAKELQAWLKETIKKEFQFFKNTTQMATRARLANRRWKAVDFHRPIGHQ